MIKYVKPVQASEARGVVAEVYTGIKHEFGTLGEPLTLHSPIPDLLAGVWSAFRECVLAGWVPRNLKEAVAATISRLNRCPYCIDAHTVMLHAAASHAAAEAIACGHDNGIEDERLRAAVAWSEATRSPGSPALLSRPFSPQEAPEFIGTAVWVHYINRMVHAFLGRKLLPIPSNLRAIRKAAERAGGWYFTRFVRGARRRAGAGMRLPELALPDDLNWAASSRAVAVAFAAFAAAVDAAGQAALPAEVRTCVLEHVRSWNGSDPGMDCAWLETAVRTLSDGHRPAARLALLAAFVPYRIDAEAVREFRGRQASDVDLLGCLAWASFTAARTIGAWL